MKKIILALLISFTALSADYVIKPDGTLTPTTTQDATTQPLVDEGTTTPTTSGAALPTKAFNVLDYGLKGDGITDDTDALNALAKNTSVTNWYFPSGYTFLIKNIKTPSHIKAIFGGGKIRAKANTSSGGGAGGAFQFPYAIDGLVIDNLYMEAEDKPYPGTIEDRENGVIYPDYWPNTDTGYVGPSGSAWRTGGHIAMDGFTNKNNIEIRNCIFDMTNFKYNGIKGYGNKTGGGGGKLTNLRIHNNKFQNYGEFGLEIIDLERVSDGSGHNVTGLHINNNDFSSTGSGLAISLVLLRAGVGNTGEADGTENRVYENIVDSASWGIEYSGCSGMYIYNNNITGIKSKMFLAGQGWLIKAVGKNFVFNNHLAEIYRDYGTQWSINNNDEYYENFISGHIIINDENRDPTYEDETFKAHDYFGIFRDNTIVLDDAASAWSQTVLIRNRHIGEFSNNDFYCAANVSRGIQFSSGGGGPNAAIKNNTFYMEKSSAICIDDGGNPTDESGNVCNQGWSGTIPTSRVGAGVTDINKIGPQ